MHNYAYVVYMTEYVLGASDNKQNSEIQRNNSLRLKYDKKMFRIKLYI